MCTFARWPRRRLERKLSVGGSPAHLGRYSADRMTALRRLFSSQRRRRSTIRPAVVRLAGTAAAAGPIRQRSGLLSARHPAPCPSPSSRLPQPFSPRLSSLHLKLGTSHLTHESNHPLLLRPFLLSLSCLGCVYCHDQNWASCGSCIHLSCALVAANQRIALSRTSRLTYCCQWPQRCPCIVPFGDDLARSCERTMSSASNSDGRRFKRRRSRLSNDASSADELPGDVSTDSEPEGSSSRNLTLRSHDLSAMTMSEILAFSDQAAREAMAQDGGEPSIPRPGQPGRATARVRRRAQQLDESEGRGRLLFREVDGAGPSASTSAAAARARTSPEASTSAGIAAPPRSSRAASSDFELSSVGSPGMYSLAEYTKSLTNAMCSRRSCACLKSATHSRPHRQLARVH